MDSKDLHELGFSEGEAEIYLELIKLGSANIMQLSKSSGRHRTHIYDTIEKLKEKGFVSESIIDNKKVFIPANPQNILDYLKEKEERASLIVNELITLQKISSLQILVETFKGKSGLTSVLRDILREKKDYAGYGEGTRFQKILPVFYEQFRNQSRKLGIRLKLIIKEDAKISRREGLEVRYLDYVSPSTVFVYANKVLIIIWEPFTTVIRITDAQVAESYNNHFRMLWKIAKK